MNKSASPASGIWYLVSFSVVKVILAGILISFIGSLPLGNVNVAAFQLAMTNGIIAALWFSAGSVIAEIIYVRLSLSIMDRILRYQKIISLLQWISLAVITGLAITSFVAAMNPESEGRNILLSNSFHPFLFGFILMGINPVQIPFWSGWAAVLFEKKIMKAKTFDYNLFTAGATVGSLGASLIFIFAGRFMTENVKGNLSVINWIIGGVFTITALLQLYKIIYGKEKQRGERLPK